jgi:hypothetical protein
VKYDVTIKSHPKDYHKLNLVVESLSFLSPQPKNIYIISPDGFLPDNTKYKDILVSVKDSEVIPNIDRDKFTERKNWAWQNSLSILQDITENDLYLDVQSDNFFIKEVSLFDAEGKPKLFRSIQNLNNNMGWSPYFAFNKNVFDLDRNWDGYSYIIEFMLYDKKILKDFFINKFESIDNLLLKMYENNSISSYLGDQEFYGSLIESLYPSRYSFVDNTPVILSGSDNDVSVEFLKEYERKIKEMHPEIIAFSYHTWRSTE